MIRKALLIVCSAMLVATIAVTGAGFIRPTTIEWRTASGTAWASIEPGTLHVAFEPDNPYPTGGGIILIDRGRGRSRGGWWPAAWFVEVDTDAQGGGRLYVGTLLPLAVLLLSTWLLSRSVTRAGRRGRGQCIACDYDLTGNTSGRCPECGTKIARPR